MTISRSLGPRPARGGPSERQPGSQLPGPVVAALRVEADCPAILDGLEAVSVELRLMHPLGAGRRRLGRRGEQGGWKRRELSPRRYGLRSGWIRSPAASRQADYILSTGDSRHFPEIRARTRGRTRAAHSPGVDYPASARRCRAAVVRTMADVYARRAARSASLRHSAHVGHGGVRTTPRRTRPGHDQGLRNLHEPRPAEQFFPSSYSPDVFTSRCRPCVPKEPAPSERVPRSDKTNASMSLLSVTSRRSGSVTLSTCSWVSMP